MRFVSVLLLISLLASFPPVTRSQSPGGGVETIDQKVERIRASLTSEERVGQLMLVTFQGSYLGADSAVAQLIANYNIGGVVLLAGNDNINGQVNTPRLVQSLTTDLQNMAYQAAEATSSRKMPRSFVPIFIATMHSGNGQPGTQIATETTPLPSYMAIGATWNPDYAKQVGQIAGQELSSMGINMLLGPSLDVLQRPQGEQALNLGVESFGGSPYWVGKMGQAYIAGVHAGASGRMAVIAQHFPGLGFADTEPDQEIPVVPRSLDDLYQVDLVPYAAVTSGAVDPLSRADGLSCANIRYQGENVRSITRPICVDEQAAGNLLSLDYFRGWRQRGILISSPLGSYAIRRYYNIRPFPHRQVAREAFLAGNDMLYLADFGPKPGDEQLDNVIDVIRFFAERYDDDPVFRAQVDESLSRILRLKLAVYNGDISYENVQTPVTDVANTGTSTLQLYTIAQASLTLIAPRRENLPPPPTRDEEMVIFTDARLDQQCSYCAAYPVVPVNGLEVAIERIYGPYAGAQIRPEQVTSFSLSQLQAYISGVTDQDDPGDSEFKTSQRIGEALRSVDWVVFVMLDSSAQDSSSNTVQEFLETEQDLVQRAKIVGISLGAPTYLSSTEISKFAAYYALYSHIQPYLDAAARAVFGETSYPGALPISLPAIGYDLAAVTLPNPAQTIEIEAKSLAGRQLSSTAREANSLTMHTGERLMLATGLILDRNGHQVPDGTPVEFTILFTTDNLQTHQYAYTVDGAASIAFTPNRTGRAQVTATSANNVQSTTFQIAIVEPGTPVPGAQPTPDISATTSAVIVGGPSQTPPEVAFNPPAASGGSETLNAARPAVDGSGSSRRLDIRDFVLSLFGLALLCGLAFSVGLSATLTVDGGVRVALSSIVAGLSGYIYYGIGGPGASELHAMLDDLTPVLIAIGAGFMGMIWSWWQLHRAFGN